MPLFGKFSIKKAPPRKTSITDSGKDIVQEYSFLEGDDDVVRLCLGDMESIFENGEWVPGKIVLKLIHALKFLFKTSLLVYR